MRVTALPEYQRLEATGQWQRGDAPPREVVVQLGEATLTLRDPRDDMALGHWSLPALVRRGNLVAPGPDSDEVLRIDDALMLSALDRIGRPVARPRRRGLWLGFLALSATGVAVALAGPPLLAQQALSAVPAAERARLARLVLADMAPLTGVPCTGASGQAALAALAGRLFGTGGAGILILPDGLSQPAALPDGTVLLPATLLATSPQALAGAALAGATDAARTDPLAGVLDHAGALATLRLMAGGALPADSLGGYGERLVRRPPTSDDVPALLARMAAAGVAPAPYAWWRDPSGEGVLPLIEADRSAGQPPPVMGEGDWQAIRAICGRVPQ